jgi:DNA-binding transcriptional MerR regulator
MKVELRVAEVLEAANKQLIGVGLEAVSKRTLDYWISMGIIAPPKRQGKGGRGLFGKSAVRRVVHVRELQEYFGFTMADIRNAARYSKLENVIGFMKKVNETYGADLIPYARAHVCSHHMGQSFNNTANRLYVDYCVAEGDEELDEEHVADLLGIDPSLVSELAWSGELPGYHYGLGGLRHIFLRSEITEWKRKNPHPSVTTLTNVIQKMDDLADVLRQLVDLSGVTSKARQELISWSDEIEDEIWRVKRLCDDAERREGNK